MSCSLRSVIPALLGLASSLPALGAEPANAPKTHTLFVGTDLAIVSKKGAAYPVRDVKDHAFVGSDGKEVIVASANDSEFSLKIDNVMKLTARSAKIEELKFEPSYTTGKDPMVKFQDAVRVGFYQSDNRDQTDHDVRWSESRVGAANASGDPAAIAGAQSALAAAQADGAAAARNFDTNESNHIGYQTTLADELARGMFDAINVSFELSAPRPMTEPYVVVIMHYLEEKGKPASARQWIYAEKLPAIDEHPRKILIRRGGFPPGYQIDSYQVHLYENGTEIATTVSRKQVALTTDEAFDYAVIEYVGNNRDKTKAPLKAKAFWPTNLTSRFVPDKLTRTLYAKVGKDGRALGLFEDENCAKPVADADIAALTPELCFLPALQKGKPVVSIAPIKLGRLN